MWGRNWGARLCALPRGRLPERGHPHSHGMRGSSPSSTRPEPREAPLSRVPTEGWPRCGSASQPASAGRPGDPPKAGERRALIRSHQSMSSLH